MKLVEGFLMNNHNMFSCRNKKKNFLVNSSFCGYVSLFVLRFYGPVNPMGSCRARSVYLTTRLQGWLSPLRG